MTTCYEYLRQKNQNDRFYHRLDNYFKALENDKLEEYHQKRGRIDDY